MSKKILTLVSFLLVAGLILAACAPQQAPATEPPAATEAPEVTEAPAETEAPVATEEMTEEPVMTEAPPEEEGVSGTITLWHAMKENEIESMNEVIAAFQAENPNVTFDVLYTPDTDLRGKYETAAATGGGPSILFGFADWGPALYDAELVADLTPYASADLLGTINEAALGAVQYKDALIGLPRTIKGVVMYRNPSIIPEAPATFEDLLAAAQEATAGDVLGADLEYGFFFSAAHLNGVGGQLMAENGDPLFNSPEGVEWMNLFLQGQEAGIPGENYTDNDVNLFKAGKVGIIIDGSWNLSSLVEAVGAENVVIDPWPTPLSGYVQTDNVYLSANATGEDAEASWAFIEYYMSPEAQTIMADPTKAAHLPAVAGVEVSDPHQQQLIEAFAGGVEFPVIPEMGAYWDPMNNAILSVLDQGTDPAAALATAEEEVNAKLVEIRGGN
jgi:arabinogalactan oligomer / maltooligosaccharide transport system substrate-binding protein